MHMNINFLSTILKILVVIPIIICILKVVFASKKGRGKSYIIKTVVSNGILVAFMLFAVSFMDTEMNKTSSYIKGQHPISITDITYGQALDSVCENQKWNRVTREYSSSDQAIVQMDADYTYGNENHKITIQFSYGYHEFKEDTPFRIVFVGLDGAKESSISDMQDIVYEMFVYYAKTAGITLDESVKDSILYSDANESDGTTLISSQDTEPVEQTKETQTRETQTENKVSFPKIDTISDARNYIDVCLGNILPEYNDLIRYEEKYIEIDYGLNVKVTQVLEEGNALIVRDDSDGSGNYFGNEFVIIDMRVLDNTKIIKDDIISIYGQYVGIKEMTRALTDTTEAIPTFNMYLCDINGLTIKATPDIADYSQYENFFMGEDSDETTYTIYDMDNDGVKELIIVDEMDWSCWGNISIYTLGLYDIIFLGSFEGGTELYASPSDGSLYAVYNWKEEYSIDQVMIENDQLNVVNVAEGDFTESDLLKQVNISDWSLLQ